MHFEILVEDQSGKKMLEILVPKIIGTDHTFKIIPYKGIGHVPRNLRNVGDFRTRLLLDNLPRLLNGYGKTFKSFPSDYHAVVIVVCDLDNNCLKEFRGTLISILNKCHTKPDTHFCIAIKEGEAWLLGDIKVVKSAYPHAKDVVLRKYKNYKNETIDGTWEYLADAVYPGGKKPLKDQGWQEVGKMKSLWAERITPFIDVESNTSPSFVYFRDKLRAIMHNV